MTEDSKKINESVCENSYPVWNPEIPVQYDELGRKIFGFCLQNPRWFKFKHIKLLSLYSANFCLPALDSYDVYKYCNGSNSINGIFRGVQLLYPDVTVYQVIDHIKKLESMGLVILVGPQTNI